MCIPRESLRTLIAAVLALVLVPNALPLRACAANSLSWPLARKAAFREKEHVWNYDGGVFFVTDGAMEGGPCFRLSGRLTAPEFFNGLKRIDRVNADTVFLRGTQVVTQFPDELRLQFVVFDFPCNVGEKPSPERKFLTREDVSSLHLALYWKRGVDLRPAENVTVASFSVGPLVPPEIAHEHRLQERLEWTYVFQVPSRGVPLTDSLVLVVRNREGRIAARVAARL